MRVVSFDPFRCLGIPGAVYLKPELIFQEQDTVRAADWVLFPEYWQINFLNYAWKKRIFPSINSYHLGHDKVQMTRALQALAPHHVPDTLICANKPGVEQEILGRFSFPFVAKKVRSSMGLGVYLVEDRARLRQYLAEHDTLYIQEYLPIDRDVRVVVVGERAVSAYWRIGSGSFKNNVAQGGRVDYAAVPRELISLAEETAVSLGINHAGFDLALCGGHAYFLEFNIFFGNQALVQAGVPIAKYVHEYIKRESQPEPPHPQLPTPRAS